MSSTDKKQQLNEKLKVLREKGEVDSKEMAEFTAKFEAFHSEVRANIQEWSNDLEGVTVGEPEQVPLPAVEELHGPLSSFRLLIALPEPLRPVTVLGKSFQQISFSDSKGEIAELRLHRNGTHSLLDTDASTRVPLGGKARPPRRVDWNEDAFFELVDVLIS